MIYLSASAIKDFMTCPARYYYRRFRSAEAKQTKEMLQGNAIHYMIEKYYDDKSKGLDYVTAFALENDLVVDDLLDLGNSFYRNFANMVSADDGIEENFKIEYSKNIYLIGKWDRVTQAGIVIDWKTSKSKPYSIANDPQFILYNYAFKRVYNREPVALLYAHLRTGEFVDYKRNDDYENLLINDVIPSMVDGITRSNYPRSGLYAYYSVCKHCAYKDICWNELDSGNLYNKF